MSPYTAPGRRSGMYPSGRRKPGRRKPDPRPTDVRPDAPLPAWGEDIPTTCDQCGGPLTITFMAHAAHDEKTAAALRDLALAAARHLKGRILCARCDPPQIATHAWTPSGAPGRCGYADPNALGTVDECHLPKWRHPKP